MPKQYLARGLCLSVQSKPWCDDSHGPYLPRTVLNI